MPYGVAHRVPPFMILQNLYLSIIFFKQKIIFMAHPVAQNEALGVAHGMAYPSF